MNAEKVAVIMLLPQCNMECDYCVIEENFSSFTIEAAQKLLLELKEKAYTNVILGGGEPTIWKGNVFELAHFAKSLGFFVQIGTNAIRLPPHFASITDIDRWILPLDSSLPEIHNQLRHYTKASGSHFDIMQSVLKQLAKAGRRVYVSTVITQINRLSLPAMLEYLQDYHQISGNLDAWNLYRLLPFGRGGFTHFDRLQISLEEFNECVQQMKNSNHNFKIIARKDMYGSNQVDFYTFHKGTVQQLPKRHANDYITTKNTTANN